MSKITTEIFIERARAVHGDRYDYSKVEYTIMNARVCIICKEHGEFMQQLKHHLSGQGCRQCGYLKNKLRKQIPFEEFVKDSKEKYGDKYTYYKETYTCISEKVKITCPDHGEFMTVARDHRDYGSGCKKCGKLSAIEKTRVTYEEFIKRAQEKHSDKYDYSQVSYTKVHDHVSILCKIHGVFQQKAYIHMLGQGCKKCGNIDGHNKTRWTTQKFIEVASRIWGDEYDYSKVNYYNSMTPITIICKKHGEFQRTPKSHINEKTRAACPLCKHICTSRIAIEWLNYMQASYNTLIQFNGNPLKHGEHRIRNSLYHADGYCEKTDTIWEFFGTWFHADIRKHHPDKINTMMNVTFGELYNRTLKKIEFCKSQGYRLVMCWELDWRRGIKALTKIQRMFLKKRALKSKSA
jgi:hypothetical protein